MSSKSERHLLLLLLVLAAALTISTAGWGHLYNETDGQYAAAAKNMARGGSWLIPENNGIPRLVKPPLLYWSMAISMKIFGVNEFAVRLPNALAITALVIITFLIGSIMSDPRRGFLAGLILLTSLGTFTLGRIVMPEPMFSAFLAGALYCALRGYDDERYHRIGFLGFWLCAALASFTKGWHGLLYPLAIIGLTVLLCREGARKFRGLISWQGILLFLMINIPWYLYIESRFPGYLNNLFFAEQLGHVIGNDAPATDYTSVPRWQFLLLHLAWFFPWSLVAGIALFAGIREIAKKEKLRPSLNFHAAFLVSWGIVIFGSVLLTGQRQDYYAMSMWPALALGAAVVIECYSPRPGSIVVALLLAASLIASFSFSLVGTEFDNNEAAATVAERATAWTTVINFGPNVWRSLRITAWLTLSGGVLLATLAAWSRQKKWSYWALAGCAVCLDLGAVSGTSLVSPYFSLASVAPEITRAAPKNMLLVYEGGLDTGSSLLFYTDHPVTLVDRQTEQNFLIPTQNIGVKRFLTEGELVSLWKSGTPITFVTESRQLPQWRRLFETEPLLVARSGTQVVLRNF